MDTVTLTIDGQALTVEKGKTVLQAAIEAGISVPYYCYHPGIGIDGSCRVCIVKIEKMPKLQTSCSTICTDGMVVATRTQEVVEARAGVFEFLLVNHPLDCPVCDKGGECPLQDFSYTFGPDQSRMEFPRRVFDGEGVKGDVDFGPTLMLNRQRCILCTRCSTERSLKTILTSTGLRSAYCRVSVIGTSKTSPIWSTCSTTSVPSTRWASFSFGSVAP